MIFTKSNLRIYLIFILSFFFGKNSSALESLSYSGRLVQTNGAPVTGTPDLKIELAYTNSTSTIRCSQNFSDVVLTNGVFHLKVDFDCATHGYGSLAEVLAAVPSGNSVAIRVTDLSNSKVYSFQAIHSMPFANVAETAKQLVQDNATDGQVLTWNEGQKKWKPGAAGGGGTVTSVTGTLPISVANGTGTPVVSISQASSLTDGYLSSADWNTFNNKQGSIAVGTTAQYYRGDKSWQTLDTLAVPENTNLYFTNARALGVPLTGFSTATGAVVATDTVLEAFGKTQGQINSLVSAGSNYLVKNGTDTISGTVSLTNVITATATGDVVVNSIPLTMTSAVNKTYVDTGDALKVAKAGDTMTGVLTLDSDLKIKGGANYVTVKGHASSAAYNLFLPSSTGTAGYVLSTDGSGNTSWINPSAVAAGSGTVNSASITDGSIVDADVNASAAIAQSKIANLTTDLAGKQPLITAGTTSQYYRGDKTFVDLGTDVRGTVLTGYAVGANAAIVAADTTLAAFGKVQGQIDATNSAVAGKEPALTAGTTSQYYRGDKSWQTLNGAAVANTAAGNIAATNVQSALNELDTEKQASITSASTVTTGSLYASGEIRFYELPGNGTNFTSLKAPDALTADINYVLPSVAPTAGQVLSSNAAGVMSWLTIPSAPVSSTFGRTGAVVATSGDYNAGLITNTASGSIAATTVQAALNELDSEKQPLITAGTTAQYYRGDKTFVDFGTDVRGTALTGFVVGANSAVVAGDSTLGAFQKVQGQLNAKEPAITAGTTAQYIRGDKTLSTFATDAINSVLSTFGLNAGSKPAVTNADTVVGAFGKVQKFLNDINSDYVSKSADQTINGTLAINSATGFITVPTPVNPNDAANKSYVDSFGQWTKSGSDIYRSGGNVGIGINAPTTSLHIYSNNAAGMILERSTNQNSDIQFKNSVGSIFAGMSPAGNFAVGTTNDLSTSSLLTIMPSGNVGVGFTNPITRFAVATPSAATNSNIRTLFGSSNNDSLDVTGRTGDVFLDHVVSATYTATAPTTLSKAVTFKIDRAPDVSDVDLTVTKPLAFWVESGDSLFGGKIGIGNSNPSYKLDIQGNNYSESSIKVRRTEASGIGPGVDFYTSTDASETATAQTIANKGLGQINFYGANETGAAAPNPSARISAYTSEITTTTTTGGSIRFQATPTGTNALTEMMRIVDNKVGIGTTNPNAQLDVAKTSSVSATGLASSTFSAYFEPTISSASSGSAIALRANGAAANTFSVGVISQKPAANDWRGLTSITYMSDAVTADQGFSINQFHPTNAQTYERFRIDSNGNVGVGTTNPQFKLHVGGNSAGGADQTVAQIGNVNAAGSGPLYLTYNAPMLSGNTYFNSGWKYAGGSAKPASIGLAGGISFNTSNSAVGAAGAAITDMNTSMLITPVGEIGIGTTSPVVPLTIDGAASGNSVSSAIVASASSTTDAFSVLPWNGMTYFGSGVYYKNGAWVHKGNGATNALLAIGGTNGGQWWSSNNSAGSWNVASGVVLWTVGGVLQGASSRAWKENFTELKKPLILEKINRLNISRWNYKSEGEKITHIGPIAEEWAREFHTGEDNKHIALIDEAGVALAGIQGLSQQHDQLRKDHDSLFQWIKNTFNKVFTGIQGHEEELALQKREIASLKAENAKLKKENDATKARLDKIEKALSRK